MKELTNEEFIKICDNLKTNFNADIDIMESKSKIWITYMLPVIDEKNIYKKYYSSHLTAQGPVVGYRFAISFPNEKNRHKEFAVRKTTYIYTNRVWNTIKENKKYPACASLCGRHNTLLESIKHIENSINKLAIINSKKVL